MKKTLLLLNIFVFSIGLNIALAQVPTYVPTNGLVGWWPFNGNANDESGNGNNGTVNGATLTTDRFGNANKAYSFNGVNAYINVPDSQSNDLDTNYSISLWYFPFTGFGSGSAPNGNGNELISKWGIGGPNNAQFSFGVTQSGTIQASNYNSQFTGYPSLNSNQTIIPNQWYHFVLTFRNHKLILYKNGICVDSISNVPYPQASNYPLDIGREGYGNYGFQKGVIDDIGIYNRALTQQEITNLYTNTTTPTCSITPASATVCVGDSVTLTASTTTSNISACSSSDLPGTLQNGLVGYWPFCGNANDASGNGNNGTVNGATLTIDRFGNSNNAYSFDGQTNYIQCPSIVNSLNAVTISGWAYCNSLMGGEFVHIGEDDNFNCNGIGIGKGGFSNVVGLNFWNIYQGNKLISLVSCVNYYDSGQTLTNGVWFHYIVIKQNNLFTYYINGILVGTTTIGTSNNPTNKIFIGSSGLPPNSKTFFSGKLDDIAIWNRALTASEIQQLYTQGQTTYTWSNGATTPSITVAPTSTTTYTCTATVNGASGSSTSTVMVNPLPTVNAGADVAVCSGNTATLSASGATTYSWNNSVSNGVAFSPAATGTYTVSGTDANGCVNTDAVLVTVNPLPTVNAGTDQMICAGTPITLNGSGATTYSWNNGVSNGVAFSPATSNTYTVIGTNANGCTNSDAVFVMVQALPNVNAGADQSVCAGTAVTLSASGATTYAWNNNVSNGTAFTPTATTTYSVSGTDANGCSNTDQVIVTVNPLPNVNAGADQSICKGDAVTLSGAGASSYAWNNNVTNGMAFNPIATATYSVSGTDANGCSNTDEVIVTVNEASTSTLTESALDSYTLNGQTYTQSGTYTQVITNSAGCDSTITLNLTLSFTGLNELAQGIQLYPNPANDVLNIQSSSALTGEYTLYDASGREVLRGTFTGALTKIDVRNIAPGTYTLQAAELMERVVVLRK
ncbi:MAG: hypothetical protein RL632_1976 [Bacteroidota bacterium]|jgi:hypothetical protein